MPLHFIEAEFGKEDDPDAAIPGKLAVCHCGGAQWVVFQIDGQNHPHIQCVRCQTSYCPKGECK